MDYMNVQHYVGMFDQSTNILAVYLETEARKSASLPETVRERARQMIGLGMHN